MDTAAKVSAHVSSIALTGVVVGLAGGAAEVVWILLFSGLTGGSAGDVAAGITATVAPGLATQSIAVPFGLGVHFGLAVGLGLAVAISIRSLAPQIAGSLQEAVVIVVLLALVWVLNFFVVLPVLNPAFVHVVPMPISLTSKLLFGVAAAVALRLKTDAPVRSSTPHMEWRP